MTQLQKTLKKTIASLTNYSDSPRLDAELLLCHCTDLSRTQLLIKSQTPLTESQLTHLSTLIKRRQQGEPIAYLLGSQPFWTLDLIVTKDTLIPRPETECLIEWVLNHFDSKTALKIADLGTGTGAIALALASERANWVIHATDRSSAALTVAQKNITKHDIQNVSLFEGNWCQALPENQYDIILSNPPYIEKSDPHLLKLQHEPQSALVAGEDGLDDIRIIAKEAFKKLKPNGLIILEHGYNQGKIVKDILLQNKFQPCKTHQDLEKRDRFTIGYTPIALLT